LSYAHRILSNFTRFLKRLQGGDLHHKKCSRNGFAASNEDVFRIGK